MLYLSTWRVSKQVLAFTLFVRSSSRYVYVDCSMQKQPISAAVVLEFSKLLNEFQNHIKTLASYLNMYAYLSLWSARFLYSRRVFHNANKLVQVINFDKIHVQLFYLLSWPISIETNGSTSLLNENF